MKHSLLDILRCPSCQGKIELQVHGLTESMGEIAEGALACSDCLLTFPIRNYIPRFVPAENYASSFGFQWSKHARTQLDKFSGLNISRNRFFKVTGWPEKMNGQVILEAASGAGRFTQIALETGAIMFSFDYSTAVDRNLENNGLHPNLHLFQADIYKIPFKRESFDKAFCFGVLQHCPNA
ncbi:MAG: methyltransferase domain-containing protein, partial [Spirochaetota bacterium]